MPTHTITSIAESASKPEISVPQQISSKKTALVLASLITFLTAYYVFFVWNVPFNSEEVGDNILGAIETPWHTHIARVLNPRTEKLAVMGGRDLLPVRVTQPMLFKLFYDMFGESLDMPIMLYRILLAPLLGVLMFLFLRRMTKNLTLSFLGSVFLLTSVPFGMAIAEIREHEPISQVFLLLYVLGFCALVQKSHNPRGWGNARFTWAAAGLWVLGMLAIRSKEPEKLAVPAISFTLLLFSHGRTLIRSSTDISVKRRAWLLILLATALTIPLFWHKDYSSQFGSPGNFFTPLDVMFWNRSAWEPERSMAFFNFRPGLPGSLFGMLGPVLSWCWLGALISVLLKARRGGGPIAYVPMLLVWLGSTLAIYMYWGANGLWDQRLMSMPMLPFTCLIFLTFHRCLALFKKPVVFKLVLIALIGVQSLLNIKHTLYLFQEYGGKDWTAHHNSQVEVYKQMTGKEEPTGLDLNRFFYQSGEYSVARKDAMWPCPANVLEPSNPLCAEYEKLLRDHGYFFLASYNPQPESAGVRFIKKLDCLNKSPYGWIIRRFSPHKKGEYFLYKVTQLPWAHTTRAVN